MKRVALILVLALHALRLALAPLFELAPQEAYYFLYAQHPALSYFDHPPAIAWLLWPFATLLGRTPLAPRLACWLAAAGTGVAFALLARRFLPRSRRPWALLVAGTTMLASVVSLFATPDVPLLLFWSLALLFLHRAVFDEGGRNAADWLLGGLFMGLAFDAKYTAVFLQVGLLLFLLLASPRRRRWLATPWPYLSLLAAHAAMAPVYAWNAAHGFASFLFQSSQRTASLGELGAVNAGKLLASQSFLLLPPLLFALAYALARAVPAVARPADRRRRSREQLLFLTCFCLPLAAAFGVWSLFSLVKPNWLLPAWITGALLALRLVRSRWVWKAQLAFALPVLALAAVEVVAYPYPVRSDDTWYGWKDLAAQVEARARDSGARFTFAADEYKTAAELRFYGDLPAYAGNLIASPARQFDYLGEDLSALQGQHGLFLDSRPLDDSPARSGRVPELLAPHCAGGVEEQEPILVRARGRVVRKFLVFLCRGYLAPESVRATTAG